MSGLAAGVPRLLDSGTTAAVVFGAHDWTDAGLGRAPSFLRSARGVVAYLYDRAGLNLDPELVLDLFDDPSGAGDQLVRMRDTLDTLLRERRAANRPVADVLIYYVGHGHTNDQGHLSLLVRRSRRGMEAETGIRASDLAQVLKVAAPQQRRLVILDCCFSEAAARSFIGMSGALDQAVAATAAKDFRDNQPSRGGLLLCSSPVGEVSMGAPNAERTLFTGAVLDVLRTGVEEALSILSFADLRDQAYNRMVVSFGANAPRPVLHPVNQSQGDLTRLPAFPNRASLQAVASGGGVPTPPTAPTSADSSGKGAHPPTPLFTASAGQKVDSPKVAPCLPAITSQDKVPPQNNLARTHHDSRSGLPRDVQETVSSKKRSLKNDILFPSNKKLAFSKSNIDGTKFSITGIEIACQNTSSIEQSLNIACQVLSRDYAKMPSKLVTDKNLVILSRKKPTFIYINPNVEYEITVFIDDGATAYFAGFVIPENVPGRARITCTVQSGQILKYLYKPPASKWYSFNKAKIVLTP